MKKTMSLYYERMTTKYPADYKKLCHDGHTIYTDYSQCKKNDKMRIDWKRSVNCIIKIWRDGCVRSIKIIEYIEKPSSKAHDAKLKVRDIKTLKEYTLWSRDLKQGDVGKLFKHYKL